MRQKHDAQTDLGKEHARTAKAKEVLAIDYPKEDETVTGPHYSFRISAPHDAARVELCINREPWQPCRQADGYWWHDCSDIVPGLYRVRARMHTHDGKERITMLRRFQAGY